MTTNIELFISGAKNCAYCSTDFAGLFAMTSAAYAIDAVYYTASPTGAEWSSQSFGINQWGFPDLPGNTRISSYEVKLYGISASSLISLSISSTLGRMKDLSVEIAPDIYYTTTSGVSLPLTTSPQDATLTFPVTGAQSSSILNAISDFGFGLSMAWSASEGDVISFDALTLGINYDVQTDSTFRNRAAQRDRLFWGVR